MIRLRLPPLIDHHHPEEYQLHWLILPECRRYFCPFSSGLTWKILPILKFQLEESDSCHTNLSVDQECEARCPNLQQGRNFSRLPQLAPEYAPKYSHNWHRKGRKRERTIISSNTKQKHLFLLRGKFDSVSQSLSYGIRLKVEHIDVQRKLAVRGRQPRHMLSESGHGKRQPETNSKH